MQEDLNHDKPGRLEDDGQALDDEAEQIEAELAVGSEADTAGDHEDDHEQSLVHILDTEDPLDEENCNRVECLRDGIEYVRRRSVPRQGRIGERSAP